jgi:hypothetical protein
MKPRRQSRGDPPPWTTVAHLNIEHYRKLLSTETDQTKRATLERLRAEEEAKLATLRYVCSP